MQRIHPKYGKGVYDEFMNGNANCAVDRTRDAVQYWTNTINQEIGPQPPSEMPFIIAAMKNIITAYNKIVPGSEYVADGIMKGIKADVFAMRI